MASQPTGGGFDTLTQLIDASTALRTEFTRLTQELHMTVDDRRDPSSSGRAGGAAEEDGKDLEELGVGQARRLSGTPSQPYTAVGAQSLPKDPSPFARPAKRPRKSVMLSSDDEVDVFRPKAPFRRVSSRNTTSVPPKTKASAVAKPKQELKLLPKGSFNGSLSPLGL
ncbi:hypothetical protein B0H14DRAFT_2726788 [Mycena olivaceomarginata]|nr:hypothetical protein B0H14DRAFT_2726788 [Mycena olivaceomarginata]